MANKELTIQDPFKGTGGYVCGERFVGRRELVQRLRRYCTRLNYSVQGLPHTGKTSLVKHSIIHDPSLVISDLPLCTAYISVDSCETKKDFYRALVNTSYSAVRKQLADAEDIRTLDDSYQDIKESGYENMTIRTLFEQTIKDLRVNLVVIYDRFDYVKRLDFDWHDFSNLYTYVSVDNVKCIVLSIRSVSDIEIDQHGKEGGSLFSQLFLSTTIALEQFNDDDIKEYWKRLTPYYENIGLLLDDHYKDTAIYYAGRNPFLLDTYNNLITQTFQDTKQRSSPEDLRIAMRRIYMSHINSLIRNNLLDMAIQVILGPISAIDKDKDDKMDLLKQYDFLRIVSEKDKRILIGHDMGFVERTQDGTDTQAYAAPSDYFTLLFKKDYAGTADFWKEWSATFRSLRILCKDFFESMWGNDWEKHIEEDAIQQMSSGAQIDEKANIAVSPLIEYLSEGSIGKLIDKYWDIFAPVFSPLERYTFKEHYNYVKSLRNHHAHDNTRFLTEDYKTKANDYLVEIGKKVNAWHQSKNELIPAHTVVKTRSISSSETPSTPSPLVNPQSSSTSPAPTTRPIKVVPNIINQPKPVISLGQDEYLGKIFKSKDSVNVEETGWRKIDKMKGFRDGYSAHQVKYQEGEWVVCKLKTEIKSDGKLFSYVIDIHPAENNQ